MDFSHLIGMKISIFLITWIISSICFAESTVSNKDLLKIQRKTLTTLESQVKIDYITGDIGKDILSNRVKELCATDRLKCSISHNKELSTVSIETGVLLEEAINRVLKNLP